MSRRRFLHCATAILAVGGTTAACTPTPPEEEPPVTAEDILAEADLAPPPTDAEVTDSPFQHAQKWSKIVTFSGTPDQIAAWITSSGFENGIESHAYRDDQQKSTRYLGEGVQKKGDRIASGVHGKIAFLVVVDQQSEPVVNVAIRHPER